ncbi:MAG TPA: acyltransferase family protein [Gaiellaceae bacterium]|nr:acyltransferase family protein [Gaiellaceae bacterium]
MRTATRHERRPDIQGLRAVAVLLVVLFHAGEHVPGGFTGVDVFFVISGFVITGTLVAELWRTGAIRLPAFYGRRVRRLLPALALMVAAVSLAAILLGPVASQPQASLTGIWASVWGANVYLLQLPHGYFDIGSDLNPFLHTWTLAVEEQFYIVFPALLLVAWRLGRGRSAAVAVMGAATAGSFALALALSHGHGTLDFYSSPTRGWEFGAGALLALLPALPRRTPRLLTELLAAGGLGAILYGARTLQQNGHFPDASALVPVLGAVAVIAAGSRSETLVGRALALRPATWLGDLSYSWYLWHWPLIVFARALWPHAGAAVPLAAALSLAPAVASFSLVENPIRYGPRFRGRRVLVLAGVSIAVSIGFAAALYGGHRAVLATSAGSRWRAMERQPLEPHRACESGAPAFDPAHPECRWPAAGSHGSAVLVGDSNAAHFTLPFVRAANRAGLDAVVATYPSCPFLDLRETGNVAPTASCLHYVEGSLAAILARRPNLVVVAMRTDGDVGDARIGMAPVAGGGYAYDPAAKARLVRQSLRSLARRLAAAGIPLLLVHPIPRLAAFDPSGCAAIRVLLGDCGASVTRAEADAARAPTLRLETGALRGVALARTLDPIGELCTPARCSSRRDGVDLYLDQDHLSRAGALRLTPLFVRAIRAAARA